MTSIEIEGVMKRGFPDITALAVEERFVYLLVQLETLMNMEGWDDFFTSAYMRYYDELVSGLALAGDLDSLEVLKDYEQHFSILNVSFTAEAIDQFLCHPPAGYLQQCRDWR